jgi:hypothetical protein
MPPHRPLQEIDFKSWPERWPASRNRFIGVTMHNPSLLVQTPNHYWLFVTGSRKVAPMRGFIIAGSRTGSDEVFRKPFRVEKIAKNLRYMIFCQKKCVLCGHGCSNQWPQAPHIRPLTTPPRRHLFGISVLPILYSSAFEMSILDPKKIQMKKFYSFKKLWWKS